MVVRPDRVTLMIGPHANQEAPDSVAIEPLQGWSGMSSRLVLAARSRCRREALNACKEAHGVTRQLPSQHIYVTLGPLMARPGQATGGPATGHALVTLWPADNTCVNVDHAAKMQAHCCALVAAAAPHSVRFCDGSNTSEMADAWFQRSPCIVGAAWG